MPQGEMLPMGNPQTRINHAGASAPTTVDRESAPTCSARLPRGQMPMLRKERYAHDLRLQGLQVAPRLLHAHSAHSRELPQSSPLPTHDIERIEPTTLTRFAVQPC